tara:strand:+ start:441 stop:653 length:213 start_codon:yes stop_codon:yes gene_type:complete
LEKFLGKILELIMPTEYLVVNVSADETEPGNVNDVTNLLNQMAKEGWDLAAAVNVYEDMDRIYLERTTPD